VLRGNLRRGLALARLRTHRAPPLSVTLYERAGCHLCEETHRALRRIGLDRPLAIERIDIAADPALERRYVVRIPVLKVGDLELDTASLGDPEIADWLRTVAPPPVTLDSVN
jgi:glutaredoxin